jgi:hypothetical protein
VRTRPAPTTNPLGRQQPFPPEQPQHPLAAHLDAALATKAGPDLAVTLAGERRGNQHLADQPEQVAIADRGRRASRTGGSVLARRA